MMVLAMSAMLAAVQPVAVQAPYAADPKLAATVLSYHNRIRAENGVMPIAWDPQLEAQARAYAQYLASIGRLVHAPKAQRPGQGENLAIGQTRYHGVESLMGTWGAERRNFRGGVFPDISTTGNWADAGHFSQLIWPTSTRLGCGSASVRGLIVLVCRYSPSGNRDGVMVGR